MEQGIHRSLCWYVRCGAVRCCADVLHYTRMEYIHSPPAQWLSEPSFDSILCSIRTQRFPTISYPGTAGCLFRPSASGFAVRVHAPRAPIRAEDVEHVSKLTDQSVTG